MPSPTALGDALDLTLSFQEGRGLLALRSPVVHGPAALAVLEMEVPGARFPVDASADLASFQRRWCRLRRAQVAITEDALIGWLRAAPLGRFGIEDPELRMGSDGIHLGFTARLADRAVPATAALRAEAAGPRRLRLVLDRVRLYGYLPVPAPQVGMALLLAAVSGRDASPEGPRLQGVAEVEIEPLEALLWVAMVTRGWRLPDWRAAPLCGIRLGHGRMLLDFGGSDGEPGVALGGAEERGLCPEGEEALAANDFDEALASYQVARARTPDPRLTRRILALLTASPSRWEAAVALAEAELAARPDSVDAALALAAIEAEHGRLDEAAARYEALGDRAATEGELEDERAALLRAAELRAGRSTARAIQLLDHLLSERPDDAQAAALLADCYAREGRWADLARLEHARLGNIEDPALRADARARLATILLDRLREPAQAARLLAEATGERPDDFTLWGLLARAREAAGDRTGALAALERSIAEAEARGADGMALVESRLRAASLKAAADDPAGALERYRGVLRASPEHRDAMAGEAEMLSRLGQHEAAAAAFERALAILPPGSAGDGERRSLLLSEAARQEAAGALDRAEQLLRRAMASGAEAPALAPLAALLGRRGQHEEAAALYAQLAAQGVAGAAIGRARSLLAGGQPAAAREVIEALSGDDARIRDRLLLDACRALGDGAGERTALERLLRGPGAASDGDALELRLRAAELALVAGDRETAAAHLNGLGDDRPEVVALRVQLLEARGDDQALEQALERHAELLHARPAARARALAALGGLRARRGHPRDSLAAYREALALLASEPMDPAAGEDGDTIRAALGRTAYLLGEWEEARRAWEPLHERGVAPRAQRALRLGEIARRQHDPVAAARFYRDSLELGVTGGDAIQAYEALAQLAEERGEIEAASGIHVEAAGDRRTGEDRHARAARLAAAAARLLAAAHREAARGLFECALAVDPEDAASLDALEALAEEANDHDRVADLLARKAALPTLSTEERVALLDRLASVQGGPLGRPDAASLTREQILELSPTHRPSLLGLLRETRAQGRRDQELAVVDRLLRAAPERPDAPADPELRTRRAQLLTELGRHDEAEAEARRVLAERPRHPGALAVLHLALERAGRLDELEAVLALRAEVEPDFDRGIDLAYRRAELLERQGRRTDAAAVYDRIVSVRPSAAAAWDRLAALHREAGQWPELLEVLGRVAARHGASGRPEEAAAVLVEMAVLARQRQGDARRARELLVRALEWDPGCALALDGLLELAREAGDDQGLDAILGRRAELEATPTRREPLLLERARLRRRGGDRSGARAVLEWLPIERAGEPALRLRAELAEEAHDHAAAATALEELSRRARAAGDLAAERAVVRRLVHLVLAEPRRGPAAELLLQRAVELDPADAEAAAALVAITRERGDQAAYLASLEALLQAQRAHPRDPRSESDTCVEIARVLLAEGDSAGALARLDEALSLVPDRADAMTLRGRALLERGDAEEAVALLQRALAEHQGGPETWAALAEAWDVLGEVALAADAFVAAAGAVTPARRGEALERAGREEEALGTWRALGGPEGRRRAAALLLRRAREASHADRPADAARLAALALAEGPCEPDALALASADLDADQTWTLLEDATAHLLPPEAAALWRSAAALLPPEGARRALERAVAAAPDVEALAALARLEGGAAGADRARAALALDPGCAAAALALATLARTPDVLPALRAAHRRCGPSDRAAISVATGEHLLADADEPAGAREAFRRALDEGASGELAARAWRALARLDIDAGDESSAREHLSTLRARGLATQADLESLADLHLAMGDADQAVSVLVSGGAPASRIAAALEAASRFEELVALLAAPPSTAPRAEARDSMARAAQIAAEVLGDTQRAISILEGAQSLGPADALIYIRLGRLHTGLGDGERAAACYARALAADPDHLEVLVPLAEYHYFLGEIEPAEDYYRQALALGFPEPLEPAQAEERARLRLRLAEIRALRGDEAGEERELRAAAAGGSVEAWRRLAERRRAAGDRKGTAEALLGWAEAAPDDRPALYREARTLMEGEAAERVDDLLLTLDPGDQEARRRVLDRLRASGDEIALARRLTEEAERASAPTRQGLRLELATLRERTGDEAGALDALLGALADGGGTLAAARRAVEAARRLGRGAEAGQILARSTDGSPEWAALVAEAFLAPGGAPEQARAFAERALAGGAVAAGSPSFRAMLRALGRWQELLVDLGIEAGRRAGPGRADLELEASEILERELQDPAAAAARAARAYDLDPTRRETAARARRLYLVAGDREHALALLDREIAAAQRGGTAAEDLAGLRAARAEILLGLGRDAVAEGELVAALSLAHPDGPHFGGVHALLGELRHRRGNPETALSHLTTAAAASGLAPDRAARATALAAALLLDRSPAEVERLLASAAERALPSALIATVAAGLAERGDARHALGLLERALVAYRAGTPRARLLLQQAMLLRAQPGHDDETYEILRQAYAADPSDPEVLAAMARVAEARREDRLLAEVLRHQLDAAPPVEERTRLALRLARLLDGPLADRAGAVRAYEEAAEGDAPVWADLARLYEADGRLAEAAQALTRLAATQQGEARGDTLRQIGELKRRVAGQGSPQAAAPHIDPGPGPGQGTARAPTPHAEGPEDLDESETRERRRLLAERDPRAFSELVRRRVAAAGDEPRPAYATLRAVLDRLPRDAVDRITELRQRLGELALRLGDHDAARGFFQLVLAQYPERVEALRPLVDLYATAGEWERCAHVLGRMAYLAPTPKERAEMTFRQAEVYRLRLRDDERAGAAYLKAADHWPEHVPTLIRLVPYYLAEGEEQLAVEVLAELEGLGGDAAEVGLEAGLALLLVGQTARGARLAGGADQARLAELLATLRPRPRADVLDRLLLIAARVLAGDPAGSGEPDAGAVGRLAGAVEQLLAQRPSSLGARAAAARLAQQHGDRARARVHLSVMAWVDPGSWAATELQALPPPVPRLDEEHIHPTAPGPLRTALRLLGPVTLGLGAPHPTATPEPALAERLQPLATAFGFDRIEAASADDLAEPAWPEPTVPPRLLVRRNLLADDEAVVFAAARALHLLRAGVPLIEERAEPDIEALLRAAAGLVGVDASGGADASLSQAWRGALEAISFGTEALPGWYLETLRPALRDALAPHVAAAGPAYSLAERLTADRIALLATGNLAAALRALTPEPPPEQEAAGARLALLAAAGPVRELVGFALSPEGLQRLA